MVFSAVTFGSHYFHLRYPYQLQDSTSSPDSSSSSTSSSPPSSDSSTGSTSTYTSPDGTTTTTGTTSSTDTSTGYTSPTGPAPSGTQTTSTTTTDSSGTTTTTNSWDGGSSTSTTTTDPTTGASVTTYTYVYTDSTGQQVTSTSTTTTITDPSSGVQTTTSVSDTGTSSTTVYDPSTGTSTMTSTYSYYDYATGEQRTASSEYVTTTDPVTGVTTSTNRGDWGSSTSYYDPNTGTSRTESTWTDPRTGETRTTRSESSSSNYVDEATGATVYEYTGTYTDIDPSTGETITRTSSSKSYTTTNTDGSTSYYNEYTYTDPQTNQPVTSVSESTYDPDTGQSRSTTTYTDPQTGNTYTSTSESAYNSETGEGTSTYTYTDPRTGSTYVSTSANVRNEDGTYTNTYTVTDKATGETVETPYYGTFGGAGAGSQYTYLDTDSGATYSYTYDGAPPDDVHSYRTPDGSTYMYTGTSGELDSLADAYGDSFANAVDADIPVGEAESHLLTQEGIEAGSQVTVDVVGEPVIAYTDFVEQLETRLETEELTQEQTQIVTAEYENFEENLKYADESTLVDVAPETSQEYNDLYDQYVPEDQRLLETPENYETMWNLRTEFYTERDAVFADATLSREEKAAALATLENQYEEKFHTQIGETKPPEALEAKGLLPSPVEEIPADTLSSLTPEAIDTMVEDKYTSIFKDLEDKGIPSNHPQWRAIEAQEQAEVEDWLDNQEVILADMVVTGCQSSVGGSAEACGQEARIVEDILDQCGTGGAGAACQEAAQIVAVQFGCESSSDKSSCIGEATRIVTEVSDRVHDDDPAAVDAWLAGVEVAPEKVEGEANYKDYRTCSSGGGSDCGTDYQETFESNVVEDYSTWSAEYNSLTSSQYDRVQQESDTRQEALNEQLEPVLATVRSELSTEEQQAVFDRIDARYDQWDGTLTAMDRAREVAGERGYDTKVLDYLLEETKQSYYASKDSLAHKDYIATVGNLHQTDQYRDLYMEELRTVVDAGTSGTTHTASIETLVE